MYIIFLGKTHGLPQLCLFTGGHKMFFFSMFIAWLDIQVYSFDMFWLEATKFPESFTASRRLFFWVPRAFPGISSTLCGQFHVPNPPILPETLRGCASSPSRWFVSLRKPGSDVHLEIKNGSSFNQLHVVYPWLTDNYTLKFQVEQPFMVTKCHLLCWAKPSLC